MFKEECRTKANTKNRSNGEKKRVKKPAESKRLQKPEMHLT